MDLCQICKKREADAKGSHVLPVSLTKNCLGQRDKENIFTFDISKPGITSHQGRDVSTSTAITQNQLVRDNIYCQQCEAALGIIEGKFNDEIFGKISDSKYHGNFKIVNTGKLKCFHPLKITHEVFWAYIYSLVYRFCKVHKFERNTNIIDGQDLEELRGFLAEFFEKKTISSIVLSDITLKFSIIGSEQMPSGVFDPISFPPHPLSNPVYFKFCELFIFIYSSRRPRMEGSIRFPISDFVSPTILLFPEDQIKEVATNMALKEWNSMFDEWIFRFSEAYDLPFEKVKYYALEYYHDKGVEDLKAFDQVEDYIKSKLL